jgi:glucose-6-phosphate 1-epimerase
LWKVEEESSFHVIMGLADNEATRAVWPHSFKISYTVRLLPRGISLHLKVTNKNETFPMTFSGCLHTYFKFDNALDVALSGFMNTTFIDKADNRREKVQDGPIFVEEESNRSAKDAGSKSKDGYGFVDRIHYESPNSFTFTERSSGKTLYNDTIVVWPLWGGFPLLEDSLDVKKKGRYKK